MSEADARKWISEAGHSFTVDACIGDEYGGEGRIKIDLFVDGVADIHVAYVSLDGDYADASLRLTPFGVRALHNILGVAVDQLPPHD